MSRKLLNAPKERSHGAFVPDTDFAEFKLRRYDIQFCQVKSLQWDTQPFVGNGESNRLFRGDRSFQKRVDIRQNLSPELFLDGQVERQWFGQEKRVVTRNAFQMKSGIASDSV